MTIAQTNSFPRGVEVALSLFEAKGVTEVFVKDPDGIWLELLSW